MTDRAQPGAIDSLVRNYELGDALGQFSGGWVVPAAEPTASAQRSDLDETAFTAFDETSSSSSLTVTIGPGEAFVDGWLATDDSRDVTLAASTTGQTVGVSWDPDAVYDPDTDADRDAADQVVVGLEGNVSSVDPFLPLWTFDTDGSGVTSAVDERALGPSIHPEYLAGANISAASSGEFVRKATDGLEFVEVETGAVVQNTEPSISEEGRFYYNPQTNLLRVSADSPNGVRWEPISPVRLINEAITFTESDLSITSTNVIVNGDRLELAGAVGNGVSFPTATDRTQDYCAGVDFEPKVPLKGIEVETNRYNTGVFTSLVLADSDLNVLAEKTGEFNGGDVLRINQRLETGKTYKIGVYDGGNQHEYSLADSSHGIDLPRETSDFKIPSGVEFDPNGTTNYSDGFQIYAFTGVASLVSETSGEAVLDWGSPQRITSWDLTSYISNPDGGSITVDIEDGSGNVLYSDVGSNFDISAIDSSKNVRVRVSLSISDISQVPSVDYVARRHTL